MAKPIWYFPSRQHYTRLSSWISVLSATIHGLLRRRCTGHLSCRASVMKASFCLPFRKLVSAQVPLQTADNQTRTDNIRLTRAVFCHWTISAYSLIKPLWKRHPNKVNFLIVILPGIFQNHRLLLLTAFGLISLEKFFSQDFVAGIPILLSGKIETGGFEPPSSVHSCIRLSVLCQFSYVSWFLP